MRTIKTHVSNLNVGYKIKGWSVKLHPVFKDNFEMYKNGLNRYNTQLFQFNLWKPTKKIINHNENTYKFVRKNERTAILYNNLYELCNKEEIKQKLFCKHFDKIFALYFKHHHENKLFIIDNTQYAPIHENITKVDSIKQYVINNKKNNETLLLSSKPSQNVILKEITNDLILINDNLRFNTIYDTIDNVDVVVP